MAEGIVVLSGKMNGVVRVLQQATEEDIARRLDEVRRAEEEVDGAFDRAATRIMGLEVLPVNPDYFLEIARGMDRISDVIERTALLLEWRRKLGGDESELLESASSQVQELAENISGCVTQLGKDHSQVQSYSAVIVDREKAVDGIRDHYYKIASKEGYDIQTRLWLSEVIGNLDLAADAAKDLSITLRSVSARLEKQRRLDVKKGAMA